MNNEKQETTAVTIRDEGSMAIASELSVKELVAHVKKIQQAMKLVMKKDVHYGVIPGVIKPSLWQPGAQSLCLMFRLDPEFQTEITNEDGGHRTVKAVCTLYHISSGNRVSSGVSIRSTRESKYAWRQAGRKCPACGKEAIIKGKAEYGGGWVCFKKKDGCGGTFSDNDERITGQQIGRVPNEDIADTYNTVVKMACKSALVAAVLNGTAASDIFTQDVEDFVSHGVVSTAISVSHPTASSIPPSGDEAPRYEPVGNVQTNYEACTDCLGIITPAVKNFSKRAYGRALCRDCQQKDSLKRRANFASAAIGNDEPPFPDNP